MNATMRCLMAASIVMPLASVGCTAGVQHGQEVSHALPSHHPQTFHRAVDAIAQRHASIVAPAVGEGDRDRARSELLDILRWLPDLAADTPLNRSNWDEVAAIAASLTDSVETGAAGSHVEEGIAALRRIEAGLVHPDRPNEATEAGASAAEGATAGAAP